MRKVKKNLQFLYLQIKSAFMSIPKIILSTIVLTFLAVLLGFAVNVAIQSSDDNNGRMVVAVVYSEESSNTYSKMAISFISEIETVKSSCVFEETDEETANVGLKDGTYAAAIIIPPHLVEDIMVGINTPIKVVYASSGVNNSSMMFRELCNAGASDLSSAEAGVYSMDDIFYTVLKNNRKNQLKAEDELSIKYFSYALNRSVYFEAQDISVNDGINSVQYYACTGIVMLLLLSGITCSGLFDSGSRILKRSLQREGVGLFSMAICTITGVSLVYEILFVCAYLGVLAFGVLKPETVFSNVVRVSSFGGLAGALLEIALLVFCVFAFIYFINTLIENEVYATLALFLTGIAGMYAAGGFVMKTLLPPMIKKIGEVLPMSGYLELAGQILTGNFDLGICASALGYAALFIVLSAVINKMRR